MTKLLVPKWPDPSLTVDDLPTPYLELDAGGFIRYANVASRQLHNPGADGLVGHRIWELMDPHESAPSKANLARMMATGEDVPLTRRSLFDMRGDYRIQELHGRLLHHADGRPAGIASVIFDITQLEDAAQEPLSRARWFESLFAALPVAVMVADAFGAILSANPAAERLSGWAAAEVKGVAVEKLFSSPTGERDCFRVALQSGCSRTLEMTCKGGGRIPVKLVAAPLMDAGSEAAFGVAMTIESPVPA